MSQTFTEQTPSQQAAFQCKLGDIFLNVNKIFASKEMFVKLPSGERSVAVMCSVRVSSIPSRYSGLSNDEFINEAFEVYHGRKELKFD